VYVASPNRHRSFSPPARARSAAFLVLALFGLAAAQPALSAPQNTAASANSEAKPTAATPTFSPPSGMYTSAQRVTISDATAGAKIYYTDDLSIPENLWPRYTGPITVAKSEFFSAYAVAQGYSDSLIRDSSYTIIHLPTPDPELNILTSWSVTPDIDNPGREIVSWSRVGTMPNMPASTQQAFLLSTDTVPNPNSSDLDFTKVLEFVGSTVKATSRTADSTTYTFLDQADPWTLYTFGRSSTLDLSTGKDHTEISYNGSVATPFSDPRASAWLFNSSRNIFVASSSSSTPVYFPVLADGSLGKTAKPFKPLSSTSSYVTAILGDGNSNPCFVYGDGPKAGDSLECADQTGRATLSATWGVVPANFLVGAIVPVLPADADVKLKPASDFGAGTETSLYFYVRQNSTAANSGVTVEYEYVQPEKDAAPKVIAGAFPDPESGPFKLAKTIVARPGSSAGDVLVDIVEQEAGAGRDVAVTEYDFDISSGSPEVTEIGNTLPGNMPGLGGANVTIHASPSPAGILLSSSSTTGHGFYIVPLGFGGNSLGLAQPASGGVSGITGQQPDSNGNILLQNKYGVGGIFWSGEYMFSTSAHSVAPNPSQGTGIVP
jgi:hypothetical protein